MPQSIAQWTAFAVTMIIVLGRDVDVLTAVPLGIAAGMLATLFQQAMRMRLRPMRLLPGSRTSRPQRVSVSSVVRAARSIRPKWRHAQFRQ